MPDLVQLELSSRDASSPLYIPVEVVCNTPTEELLSNIKTNSARPISWIEEDWLEGRGSKQRNALIIGGGPSVRRYLDIFKGFHWLKGDIFALNGAGQMLTREGIKYDYQVIADAQPVTAELVDTDGSVRYLIASQVNPLTLDRASDAGPVTLWHLHIEGMEDQFPAERVAKGGYSMIGGGTSVGVSTLCLAYTMGYRHFELYGFDSSHDGDDSHAYEQPWNAAIPTVWTEWAGKRYRSQLAMKAQAEKLMLVCRMLKQRGCSIAVHGKGLFPAMWNTPVEHLGERDKYRLMWTYDAYREHSPGEELVDKFIRYMKPAQGNVVIDVGCGTGRASIKMAKYGLSPIMIDFASNCLDEEAKELPFIEWDITAHHLPVRGHYAFCADVLEHIPTEKIDLAVATLAKAAEYAMVQVSTRPDSMGALIGHTLHNTVKDHVWWAEKLCQRFDIEFQWRDDDSSVFCLRSMEKSK